MLSQSSVSVHGGGDDDVVQAKHNRGTVPAKVFASDSCPHNKDGFLAVTCSWHVILPLVAEV